MLMYYKTNEKGELERLSRPEKGCWINVWEPTAAELTLLQDKIGVVPEFIRASLDEEETSYIDQDEEREQVLVIADYPVKEEETASEVLSYSTLPLGIVFMPGYVVTISSAHSSTIQEMEQGKIKVNTIQKTRLLLLILLSISQKFLYCLRQIDRMSTQTEKHLYDHMDNKFLIRMLQLDKSLIYFSTSLKADELTLHKIMRGRQIKLYPDDTDLLEDVIIEIRQAVEMCDIYSNINARTMDGFSNVLSNNMNNIMKELTIITIVMSIPNMVYGFYGMNVEGLPFPFMWFPFLLSLVLCVLTWLYFQRNHRLK